MSALGELFCYINMKITDLNTKKELIALRVRTVLDEKGWSQQKLADAMGVNKSYVSKILAGEQNMTWEGITTIERALNSPIIDIRK